MTASYIRSTASGSTANFSIPFGYLDRTHVHVYLDEVETEGFTWASAGTITLDATPGAGVVVERKRITPPGPLVDFEPGNLSSDDLDNATRQSIYLAQEASDTVSDFSTRAYYAAAYGTGKTIAALASGHFWVADSDGNMVDGGAASVLPGTVEVQDDETLAGESSTEPPSERAVKTYVDDATSGIAASITPAGIGAATAAQGTLADSSLQPGDVGNATAVRAKTAAKLLDTDGVWGGMAEVTLTDASTIAWDMALGFDFTVTLGADRTLGNASNPKVGQRGRIRVVQDATGGRTLTKSSHHKTAGGGALVIPSAANAECIIYYDCVSSTKTLLSNSPLAWS